MAGLKILGGSLNNSKYLTLMGAHYADVPAMTASIQKLQASGKIDIATMKYGDYQGILEPFANWPITENEWLAIVGRARQELAGQTNSTRLSKDQADVVPVTRCDLLDASIRKCFNPKSPIPIAISIGQQPMDSARADTHEIILVWEYDNGDDALPTRLNLMMMCPYKAVPMSFGSGPVTR
jgi:hypothetical protein